MTNQLQYHHPCETKPGRVETRGVYTSLRPDFLGIYAREMVSVFGVCVFYEFPPPLPSPLFGRSMWRRR